MSIWEYVEYTSINVHVIHTCTAVFMFIVIFFFFFTIANPNLIFCTRACTRSNRPTYCPKSRNRRWFFWKSNRPARACFSIELGNIWLVCVTNLRGLTLDASCWLLLPLDWIGFSRILAIRDWSPKPVPSHFSKWRCEIGGEVINGVRTPFLNCRYAIHILRVITTPLTLVNDKCSCFKE